jgi:hypothetical protein
MIREFIKKDGTRSIQQRAVLDDDKWQDIPTEYEDKKMEAYLKLPKEARDAITQLHEEKEPEKIEPKAGQVWGRRGNFWLIKETLTNSVNVLVFNKNLKCMGACNTVLHPELFENWAYLGDLRDVFCKIPSKEEFKELNDKCARLSNVKSRQEDFLYSHLYVEEREGYCKIPSRDKLKGIINGKGVGLGVVLQNVTDAIYDYLRGGSDE